MEAASINDEKNWCGGYYELSIELGPRDDSRLERALATLWGAPGVEGPFPSRSLPREDQERVSPTIDNDNACDLCGVARMPSGASVVCRTIVRFEEDSD